VLAGWRSLSAAPAIATAFEKNEGVKLNLA